METRAPPPERSIADGVLLELLKREVGIDITTASSQAVNDIRKVIRNEFGSKWDESNLWLQMRLSRNIQLQIIHLMTPKKKKKNKGKS